MSFFAKNDGTEDNGQYLKSAAFCSIGVIIGFTDFHNTLWSILLGCLCSLGVIANLIIYFSNIKKKR